VRASARARRAPTAAGRPRASCRRPGRNRYGATARRSSVRRSGAPEAVAHGRWATAVELPPPGKNAIRGKREAILRPQERLAAILSGRDVALAAEELTLRARMDLDAGRTREAALQLRVALEAAIAELEPWAEGADLGARLEALRELRQSVASAANAALQGGLDDASAADVDFAVGRIEAALRVRTNLGLT
jgi:hypothetical protein